MIADGRKSLLVLFNLGGLTVPRTVTAIPGATVRRTGDRIGAPAESLGRLARFISRPRAHTCGRIMPYGARRRDPSLLGPEPEKRPKRCKSAGGVVPAMRVRISLSIALLAIRSRKDTATRVKQTGRAIES